MFRMQRYCIHKTADCSATFPPSKRKITSIVLNGSKEMDVLLKMWTGRKCEIFRYGVNTYSGRPLNSSLLKQRLQKILIQFFFHLYFYWMICSIFVFYYNLNFSDEYCNGLICWTLIRMIPRWNKNIRLSLSNIFLCDQILINNCRLFLKEIRVDWHSLDKYVLFWLWVNFLQKKKEFFAHELKEGKYHFLFNKALFFLFFLLVDVMSQITIIFSIDYLKCNKTVNTLVNHTYTHEHT